MLPQSSIEDPTPLWDQPFLPSSQVIEGKPRHAHIYPSMLWRKAKETQKSALSESVYSKSLSPTDFPAQGTELAWLKVYPSLPSTNTDLLLEIELLNHREAAHKAREAGLLRAQQRTPQKQGWLKDQSHSHQGAGDSSVVDLSLWYLSFCLGVKNLRILGFIFSLFSWVLWVFSQDSRVLFLSHS